jgi:hypothetical protein
MVGVKYTDKYPPIPTRYLPFWGVVLRKWQNSDGVRGLQIRPFPANKFEIEHPKRRSPLEHLLKTDKKRKIRHK